LESERVYDAAPVRRAAQSGRGVIQNYARWHDLRHTGAFWAVHAAVRASSAVNDPAVRELARRFTADVAAMDTEEAAWLKQPRAVSIDASPRPLAEASDQPRSRLQTTATTSISSRPVVRQSY
jgi:hypothetical protein